MTPPDIVAAPLSSANANSSDTFCSLRPPRTATLPFRAQPRVECACRLPLSSSSPRWTAERFPVLSNRGWTCAGKARRTHRPVGDAHPQRPSPPPQAALRDARDRRAGLRGRGIEGEARAGDGTQEGDGVSRRPPQQGEADRRSLLVTTRGRWGVRYGVSYR